jgi:hypothetical protein
MILSGQFQALAALPLVKRSRYPLNGKLAGPHSWSSHFGESEYRITIHGSPIPWLCYDTLCYIRFPFEARVVDLARCRLQTSDSLLPADFWRFTDRISNCTGSHISVVQGRECKGSLEMMPAWVFFPRPLKHPQDMFFRTDSIWHVWNIEISLQSDTRKTYGCTVC